MPAIGDVDLGVFSGHSYLLIGGLLLVGIGLLIISLVVNRLVAHSVRREERHNERLYEYYRNTFSQLGVILIGIGVSLFIFFFQQNYQDQRRREVEVQQALTKMAVRVTRLAALARSLGEYDNLLDDGGPYLNPEDGGSNQAVTATGPQLAEQVRRIRVVERDIDLSAFGIVQFSRDLETSALVHEINPHLWFALVTNESDVDYAVTQLERDYADLAAAVGPGDPGAALVDPERAQAVKAEVLDVLWDLHLLRDRTRRILGLACRFVGAGQRFVALEYVEALEDYYASHQEWIEHARMPLGAVRVGGQTCFDLLHFEPPR